MKTIAFFSYKGGTGRSLLLGNYATYLAKCGRSVVMLDLDLEAPGLHHKFASKIRRSDETTKLGLLDYFLYCQDTNRAPSLLKNYARDVDFGGSARPGTLFPAGDAPTKEYAAKMLGLNWWNLFPDIKGMAKGGINLVLQLKSRIIEEYNDPDFLLIDSRTGITDIVGYVIPALAELMVCTFLCNDENIQGTIQMVNALRDVSGKSRLSVLPILSRIPVNETQEAAAIKKIASSLQVILSATGIKQIPILHDEPSLHIAEELLFGSDKALYESTLLRDYLLIFKKLDQKTAEKSKYFSLFTEQITANKRASLDPAPPSMEQTHVIENIRNHRAYREGHPTLRHFNIGYVSGESYKEFIGSGRGQGQAKCGLIGKILHLLGERKGIKKVPIENIIEPWAVNWELLAPQLSIRTLDFCSDPFYLTPHRSLYVDLVPFGKVTSFALLVRENSKLETACQKAEGKDLAYKIISMQKSCKRLVIAFMGETAAATEASRVISVIIPNSDVRFMNNANTLAEFICDTNRENGLPGERVVICDHALAIQIRDELMKLAKKSNRNIPRYVFPEIDGDGQIERKHLTCEYSILKDIPAGFMIPKGDREWRYLVNQAVADVVGNNAKLWMRVQRDLRRAGIDPQSFDGLRETLISGMTPDDALKCLQQWGSAKPAI